MPATRLPLAIICAWAMTECASVSVADAAPGAKPRLVVMTDICGDPDDEESMVRFLLYACDFDVEGLCTGSGHGNYKSTRPDLLHKAVDAYGQVLPNLHQHRPDYPSHERLKSLIKDGHNGDPSLRSPMPEMDFPQQSRMSQATHGKMKMGSLRVLQGAILGYFRGRHYLTRATAKLMARSPGDNTPWQAKSRYAPARGNGSTSAPPHPTGRLSDVQRKPGNWLGGTPICGKIRAEHPIGRVSPRERA